MFRFDSQPLSLAMPEMVLVQEWGGLRGSRNQRRMSWKESKLAKLAADQALCLSNEKAAVIRLTQFSKSIT